jgi:hypothetical protein
MKALETSIWHRLQDPQLARRVIFATLLFFAAIASFNGFFSKNGFLDTPGPGVRSFTASVDGISHRPYIYRQLVPGIANWANQVVPPSLLHALANVHGDNVTGIYSIFSSPIAHDPVYSFRYLVMYVVCVTSAILAAFFLYLVCRAEGHTPLVAVTAAVVLILLIPYFQIRGAGVYTDYPELAFLAMGVWAAQRFHWLWLVPVAILGTANKESFILIVLTFWPLLRVRYGLIFSILQIGVLELFASATYWAIRLHFPVTVGETVHFHLIEQIQYLLSPTFLLTKFGRAYGVFVPEAGTLVPVAILIWLVWLGGRRLSPRISQHALLALAINVPLFFLFCDPGEMRDFSLLYVAFMLCLAGILSAAATAPGSPLNPKSELPAEEPLATIS